MYVLDCAYKTVPKYQAGNVGVLRGAERFDNARGNRFSTYVQYWIKKSILTLVERHSRGIQIPV